MFERDGCTHALGIQLDEIAPDFARMSMRVTAAFLNGHKTCHGGMIFALADSAFAFACNTANRVTVAAGCSIEFLKPAYEGDVLHAEARGQTRVGRHGIYDVAVRNDHGEVVAMFRGKSAELKGEVVPTAE
ncbi:hydroxyphenylacetyl-CoA thioesterase PaaI [Chitinasiproducens palmae]|nr:hydroxyphenylacetyl-CoA thioesterase PaaI [Chitinasiproducens palmae]